MISRPLQRHPLPPAVAAARAAACLRALADALAQRPDEAPWVDIRWLDPLRRVVAPASVAALRGDAALITNDRRCRSGIHNTRRWAPREGGGAWLSGWAPPEQTSLWDEVARWASARPDKHYGLNGRSAAVLRQTAGLLEAEWKLPEQPARWCGERRSRFDCALFGLGEFFITQLFKRGSDLIDRLGFFDPVQGPFDLLDLDSPAHQSLDPAARLSLHALAERLLAAWPRHTWQRARICLQAPLEADDEWAVGFELVAQAPFMLQTLWMESGRGRSSPFRLGVRDWPDALQDWIEPFVMRTPAPKATPVPWFGDSPDIDLKAPIPMGADNVLNSLPVPQTFRPGLWVRHRTFGAGLVLSVQGEGAQALANVQWMDRQHRLVSVQGPGWNSVSDTWPPPHSIFKMCEPSETLPDGIDSWERTVAGLEQPPSSAHLGYLHARWRLDLTFRLLITKDVDLLTARGTPPAPELMVRLAAADARMLELTLPTEHCLTSNRAENPAWRPQDDPVRHFYAWRWPAHWPAPSPK